MIFFFHPETKFTFCLKSEHLNFDRSKSNCQFEIEQFLRNENDFKIRTKTIN